MALHELDAFAPPVLLGFVRAAYEATPQTYQGSTWLPDSTVDDLAFEYLLGANRRQAMATILSFDAEAPLGQRAGAGERIIGELPPIKRKMRIGEKEIIRFLNPRVGTGDVANAIDQVYQDFFDLTVALQSRAEWMKMQAMSEDLLIYDEDGVKFAFDYGINGDFQWNVPTKLDNHSRWGNGATNRAIPVGGPWNNPATATYVNDLQQMCDFIQRTTGQRPTRFTCSLKMRNIMLNSQEIKNLVRGTVTGTTQLQLTPNEIQGIFAQYNLPTINTYDASVTKELPDGSMVDVRCMAENKAFLDMGGPVGRMLHGPTAESRALSGTALAAAGPGVWANTYATDEPPAEWSKVAMVAFPTIPEMNRVGQMTLY
jgi:hypothetical protein